MGLAAILLAAGITGLIIAIALGAWSEDEPKRERINQFAYVLLFASLFSMLASGLVALWRWAL